MAISAHQPVPDESRMYLLVEDALRLWRDIPDGDLMDAVEAAIVDAGNFMATAGGVKRAWLRESEPKTLMLGHVESAPAAMEKIREWEAWWASLTEGERETEQAKHREFFAGLAGRLAHA